MSIDLRQLEKTVPPLEIMIQLNGRDEDARDYHDQTFRLEEIGSYAKSTSPGFGISTNRRHKTIPWTTSVNVPRRFSRKILCRALA